MSSKRGNSVVVVNGNEKKRGIFISKGFHGINFISFIGNNSIILFPIVPQNYMCMCVSTVCINDRLFYQETKLNMMI